MGWVLATIAAPFQPSVRITHHIIQDLTVVRIPVAPRPPRLVWEVKKGPKCIPLGEIRGAVMGAPSSVDFVMRGGERFRAQFDGDCPALDFYGDFYVESKDDDVCAKREEVRSRMGGSCTIMRFNKLALGKAG